MSKKISDLNSLEEMLEPVQIGGGSEGPSLEMELAELEKQKIKLAEKFLSSDIQKTEINNSERKLIPLLRLLASNPFGLPEKDVGEYEHKELKIFLDEYLMLGIPLNRKGRKEEVSVMTSLFNSSPEINTDEGGKYSEQLKRLGR